MQDKLLKYADSRRGNKILEQALRFLHLKKVFYTKSMLTAPWGISLPQSHDSLIFHFVTSGKMVLELSSEHFVLNAGDFVIVPQGERHVIKSENGAPISNLKDLSIEVITKDFQTLEFGDGGESCELVCGHVTFEDPAAHRFLQLLPRVLKINSTYQNLSNTIHTLIKLLSEETQNPCVGGEIVISRLTDILVIKTLRAHLKSSNASKQFNLLGVRDKKIAKAIACLHEKPHKKWRLLDLAQHSGMSRTSFALTFKELVGTTPMNYLNNWRMAVARNKLLQSDERIVKIALDVGYSTEASFSRAFKSTVGISPSDYRKSLVSTKPELKF